MTVQSELRLQPKAVDTDEAGNLRHKNKGGLVVLKASSHAQIYLCLCYYREKMS